MSFLKNFKGFPEKDKSKDNSNAIDELESEMITKLEVNNYEYEFAKEEGEQHVYLTPDYFDTVDNFSFDDGLAIMIFEWLNTSTNKWHKVSEYSMLLHDQVSGNYGIGTIVSKYTTSGNKVVLEAFSASPSPSFTEYEVNQNVAMQFIRSQPPKVSIGLFRSNSGTYRIRTKVIKL